MTKALNILAIAAAFALGLWVVTAIEVIKQDGVRVHVVLPYWVYTAFYQLLDWLRGLLG